MFNDNYILRLTSSMDICITRWKKKHYHSLISHHLNLTSGCSLDGVFRSTLSRKITAVFFHTFSVKTETHVVFGETLSNEHSGLYGTPNAIHVTGNYLSMLLGTLHSYLRDPGMPIFFEMNWRLLLV